jgi:peptidoglycan/LPS O-acetylase OafA/YrhL
MKQRLSFIDALRGIAALGVVFYHIKDANHIPTLEARLPWIGYFLEYGHFGVPIFFVLSGFVIALSLDGRPMGLSTVGWFMMRRSIRLDPPYWVAIVVAIAAGFAKERTLSSFSPSQIIAHLFYMQELLGYREISIVFWTLCLEIQFYVTYSLLMCSPRQDVALMVAIAISILWPLHILPVLSPGLFLHLWHGFLLGVCAYWTLRKGFPLLVFFTYALVVGLFGGSFSTTCALAAGLIVIVGLRNKLDSLNWRWIQGLGAISYSLYLLHTPVTGATFRIADQISKHTVVSEIVWWAISLALCISAATLLWWAVEKPSTSLARRLRLNPKSTGGALVTVPSPSATD